MYSHITIQSQSRGGNITRKNTPFKEAIVFTVGGGNYVEYQNLLDYAKVCVCPNLYTYIITQTKRKDILYK